MKHDLDLSDVAEQRAWNALSQRIAAHKRRVWYVRTAAAAVVLITVIGINYVSDANDTRHTTPGTRTYVTRPAQRANVTLADGSTVILAPATTLRATGRSVELDGEAVFTVTQRSQEPFVVRAGNSVTRVLGTTFGVKAYDSVVTVTVSDGRVSVNNATLSANDVASVNNANGATRVQHNANVSALLALTRGELVLRDVPLGEAIPDLNRWYDVDIRLADPSLAKLRLSATFAAGTPEQLVQLLEPTLQVRIEREGRGLRLYPR